MAGFIPVSVYAAAPVTAELIKDPAMSQYLVGIAANAIVQALFRGSQAHNGNAPVVGMLAGTVLSYVGGLIHLTPPVPSFDIALGNNGVVATGVHSFASIGQGVKYNGAAGAFKETPKMASERLSKVKK